MSDLNLRILEAFVYVQGYIRAFGLRSQILFQDFIYKLSIIKSTLCFPQSRLTVGQWIYKNICNKFRKSAKFSENRELFFYKPSSWLATISPKRCLLPYLDRNISNTPLFWLVWVSQLWIEIIPVFLSVIQLQTPHS